MKIICARTIIPPHRRPASPSLSVYLNLIPPSELWLQRPPHSHRALDQIPRPHQVQAALSSPSPGSQRHHTLPGNLLIACSLLSFWIPGLHLDSALCCPLVLQSPGLPPINLASPLVTFLQFPDPSPHALAPRLLLI